MPCDVVIVGAGPNGLLMAGELALAGVHPVVVEQGTERARLAKANALIGRVVQALDYRGLYQRLSGSDRPPQPAQWFTFAALDLDLTEVGDAGLCALAIPQVRLEEHLEARALELGADLRRGHTVTGLTQDERQVLLDVSGPGGEHRLAARYVVAADGGHSTVRKSLGIGFPGITDDSFISRSGQVVIDPPVAVSGTGELDIPGLGRLAPGFTRTETGMFAYLPFAPGNCRVVVSEWEQPPQPDTDRMPIDELRAAVRRVLGAEVAMSYPTGDGPIVRRRATGTNSRQADRYRAGRVFLAGDAAHVHSGIGAPGLNLGLQDVFNLGWKLAATIRGHGGDRLLDSYQAERHPVGARVLLHSRAQHALLRPGANTTALRQVFGELLGDTPAVRRIAALLAGSDTYYPPPCAGKAEPSGDHPFVGRWMPDLPVETASGTTRVAELLHPARPVLLQLGGDTDLSAVSAGWHDRVDHVRGRSPHPPADAVLIRPDGFVAWAIRHLDDHATGLPEALRTWFGPPASELSSQRPGTRDAD